MDESGLAGERPRQRFVEKATKAGFHELMARWRPDLVGCSLNTLALVWPEEAHAFNQVIVRGLQVKEVAAAGEVSVRTVHRRLAGHGDRPGAEDWFLITLQLYRESDFVYPNGADALRDCFLGGDWGDEGVNTCLRVFFLTLLEAAAGGDVRAVLDTVPWRPTHAGHTLAWPCYAERPPLERSLLPGLLTLLQGAQSLGDRLRLIMLTSFFASDEPRLWRELLSILNMGGCRGVAERGRIPPEHLVRAEAGARLLLSGRAQSGPRAGAAQYAILGLLAQTPLLWESLCACVGDATLRGLMPAERLHHCARLYLRAQL